MISANPHDDLGVFFERQLDAISNCTDWKGEVVDRASSSSLKIAKCTSRSQVADQSVQLRDHGWIGLYNAFRDGEAISGLVYTLTLQKNAVIRNG